MGNPNTETPVQQKTIESYVKHAKRANTYERATRMLCNDEIVVWECPKCDAKFSFTEGVEVPKGTKCPFCKVDIIKSKKGIDRRKDLEKVVKEDKDLAEPDHAVILVVKGGHMPSELAQKMLATSDLVGQTDVIWADKDDPLPVPRLEFTDGTVLSGNALMKRLRS